MDNLHSTTLNKSRDAHPTCYERNSNIPYGANRVLSKMLSVDPDDRYPNNTSAVNDLTEVLSGRDSFGSQIFISFSHQDIEFVSKLVEDLQIEGFNVWWDRHLDHGIDWDEQVEEAMHDSQFMLMILSPDSVNSAEAKREWKYWIDDLDKPVIPILYRKCIPPYRYSKENDLLWPDQLWLRMKFDKALTVSANGGHGPIGYFVEEYVPGKRVVFRFTGPKGFDGYHGYDVYELEKDKTELRETLKMTTHGMAQLTWPMIFRPLYDALIEDSLCFAELRLNLTPTVSEWSWWVKFLLWAISGGKSRPQKIA